MPQTYRNQVLATLATEDLEALQPHLVPVDLAKHQVLTEQDTPVDVVYFPETADLANLMMFRDGRAVETAVVGSEGVSGLAAFLADAPCAWRVSVQLAGTAYRLEAGVLRDQVGASPRLRARLLEVTHDNQSQAAQTAACNAVHEITPRLARWLLLIHDRSNRDRIDITQEDLAANLGVQRTSINGSANDLRAAGAIQVRRGAIAIRDRARLEAAACECYAAQRARSQAFGIVSHREAHAHASRDVVGA